MMLRSALLCLSLLAGSAAADAVADPSACKYAQAGSLPLRFLSKSAQPVVEGSINGAPATMLVFSGLMTSTLTDTAVKRLDLATRLTTRRTVGVRSGSNLASVQLNEFGIGPTHVARLTIDVRDDMHHHADVDAYVGADFLFQADVEFSFAEKSLRFFRPIDCGADSYLAYWGEDAMRLPITGNFGRSKNGLFTVELNGVKMDALIDTGASRSLVYERAASKAGVGADDASNRDMSKRNVDNEGLVLTRSAVFSTFTIGNETIHDAELLVARDPNVIGYRADVLLGADFLRTHRVLFATSQRQVYVSYIGGDVFKRRAASAKAAE